MEDNGGLKISLLLSQKRRLLQQLDLMDAEAGSPPGRTTKPPLAAVAIPAPRTLVPPPNCTATKPLRCAVDCPTALLRQSLDRCQRLTG
ncbi:hypothetical protein LY78DRAFT_664627 [Colletotrichum sublineola]|nr:hypothetical protein LY78DRAFT_664627 [Colletotrichum sublineola]